MRAVTPSVAMFGPLCVIAGVTGAFASFVLACAEQVNWPPAPALILCVIATSALTALTTGLIRFLGSPRQA